MRMLLWGGQPLLLRRASTFIACILVAMAGGAAFADEITTSTSSSPQASSNGEPPPGGCLPIGVTASGEVVFPLLCKSFLERNKGVAAAPDEQQRIPEHLPLADQKADHDSKILTDERKAEPAERSQTAPSASETVSSIKSPKGLPAAPEEQKSTPEHPPSIDQNLDHDNKVLNDQQAAVPVDGTQAAPTTVETVPAIKSSEGVAASVPQKLISESPPSTDEKADHDSKIVTDQQEAESMDGVHAATTPAETVSSIKLSSRSSRRATASMRRLRKSTRKSGERGCTHYRTFDPRSETYRDYSGRRRTCRS